MRVFAVGDIHGDSEKASKLAIKAKEGNADLVVLCGDLTNFEKSTKNIVGSFKKLNLEVAMLHGNHESNATVDYLAKYYDSINIHGKYILKNNLALFGYSSVNVGINAMSEQNIFDGIKSIHSKIENIQKKIMFSHTHPAGTKMESLSKFLPGSTGVRFAIDKFQPDMLLCAHIHEAEGVEEYIGKTKLVNVSGEGRFLDL